MSEEYDPEVDGPSDEDTAHAMNNIAAGRDVVATRAITEMARAIIRAVRSVDMTHNVGKYVEEVSVVCDSPGVFRLNVKDRSTNADIDVVHAVIQQELDGFEYHKVLRPIVIEGGSDEY